MSVLKYILLITFIRIDFQSRGLLLCRFCSVWLSCVIAVRVRIKRRQLVLLCMNEAERHLFTRLFQFLCHSVTSFVRAHDFSKSCGSILSILGRLALIHGTGNRFSRSSHAKLGVLHSVITRGIVRKSCVYHIREPAKLLNIAVCWQWHFIFIARRYASVVYAVVVCLSVRPSVVTLVTSRHCTKTAKLRITKNNTVR